MNNPPVLSRSLTPNISNAEEIDYLSGRPSSHSLETLAELSEIQKQLTLEGVPKLSSAAQSTQKIFLDIWKAHRDRHQIGCLSELFDQFHSDAALYQSVQGLRNILEDMSKTLDNLEGSGILDDISRKIENLETGINDISETFKNVKVESNIDQYLMLEDSNNHAAYESDPEEEKPIFTEEQKKELGEIISDIVGKREELQHLLKHIDVSKIIDQSRPIPKFFDGEENELCKKVSHYISTALVSHTLISDGKLMKNKSVKVIATDVIGSVGGTIGKILQQPVVGAMFSMGSTLISQALTSYEKNESSELSRLTTELEKSKLNDFISKISEQLVILDSQSKTNESLNSALASKIRTDEEFKGIKNTGRSLGLYHKNRNFNDAIGYKAERIVESLFEVILSVLNEERKIQHQSMSEQSTSVNEFDVDKMIEKFIHKLTDGLGEKVIKDFYKSQRNSVTTTSLQQRRRITPLSVSTRPQSPRLLSRERSPIGSVTPLIPVQRMSIPEGAPVSHPARAGGHSESPHSHRESSSSLSSDGSSLDTENNIRYTKEIKSLNWRIENRLKEKDQRLEAQEAKTKQLESENAALRLRLDEQQAQLDEQQAKSENQRKELDHLKRVFQEFILKSQGSRAPTNNS